MSRHIAHLAPLILFAHVPSLSAQPLLNIADGFESNGFNVWGSIITLEAIPGTFIASGGNPDRYARLIATTSATNRTGTGFLYFGPNSFIRLGSTDTQIILGADLRLTSAIPATPLPEFVPIVRQNNRIYQPATFIPAPTLDQWTTAAPVTFRVGDFTNSSGIPLDVTTSVQVGFFLRMPVAPTSAPGTQFGVGVDNVVLTVVPTPSTAAIILAPTFLATFARRRRP